MTELNKLGMKELKDMCKSKGIKKYSDLKKLELIKLISDHIAISEIKTNIPVKPNIVQSTQIELDPNHTQKLNKLLELWTALQTPVETEGIKILNESIKIPTPIESIEIKVNNEPKDINKMSVKELRALCKSKGTKKCYELTRPQLLAILEPPISIPEFDKLNLSELRDKCKSYDIKKYSKLNKVELVQLLISHWNSQNTSKVKNEVAEQITHISDAKLNKDELHESLRCYIAKKYESEDKSEAVVDPAMSVAPVISDDVKYDKLSICELHNICKEKGITKYKRLNKTKLIELIELYETTQSSGIEEGSPDTPDEESKQPIKFTEMMINNKSDFNHLNTFNTELLESICELNGFISVDKSRNALLAALLVALEKVPFKLKFPVRPLDDKIIEKMVIDKSEFDLNIFNRFTTNALKHICKINKFKSVDDSKNALLLAIMLAYENAPFKIIIPSANSLSVPLNSDDSDEGNTEADIKSKLVDVEFPDTSLSAYYINKLDVYELNEICKINNIKTYDGSQITLMLMLSDTIKKNIPTTLKFPLRIINRINGK
jgi:hypothetical protein